MEIGTRPHSPLVSSTTNRHRDIAGSLTREQLLAASTAQCADTQRPLRSQPRFPKYSTQHQRLQSYTNWPPNLRQTPEELAEAGFYYTGQLDRVVCYFCGVILVDWDPEDDPWFEHARWNSDCEFLLGIKGKEFARSVNETVNRSSQVPANSTSQQTNGRQFSVPTNNEIISLPATGRTVIHNEVRTTDQHSESSITPTYSSATYEQNLRPNVASVTFNRNASTSVSRSPQINLATEATREQCPTDRESNSNPSMDETVAKQKVERREIKARLDTPIIQKILSLGYKQSFVRKVIEDRLYTTGDDFPNAASLLQAIFELENKIEGRATGNDCKMELEDDQQPTTSSHKKKIQFGPTDGSTTDENLVVSSRSYSLNDETSNPGDSNKTSEDKMCRVCLLNPFNTTFYPCGHLVCCASCAYSVSDCPICRSPIEGRIRTYMG